MSPFVRLAMGLACSTALTWLTPAAGADDPLPECKAGSLGDIALVDCLSLAHEESEVALAGVQESLNTLLSETYNNSNIGGSLAAFWAQNRVSGQSKQATEPRTEEEGRRVIAIVDGLATSMDERSISIAPPNDGTPDTAPPPVSRRDPLSGLADEPQHYYRYRDNRCAWLAQFYAPGETAWAEISCKTRMNLERITELRTLLAQRNRQKQLGYKVRGRVNRNGDQLGFRPCGATQSWLLNADESVRGAIENRLTELNLGAGESAYIELQGVRKGISQTAAEQGGYAASLQARRLDRLRALNARDCVLDAITLTPIETALASEIAIDSPANPAPTAQPPTGAQPAQSAVDIEPLEPPPPPAPSPEPLPEPAREDNTTYAYFQSWGVACGAADCLAFSDSESGGDQTWRLQVNRHDADQADLILVGQSDIRIGRDIGIFVDLKPVGNRRLSVRETRRKANQQLLLKGAGDGLALLKQLRQGKSLQLVWTDYDSVEVRIEFSLWGLTRALGYAADP